MSTTNSVNLVFHDGQTSTAEPLPVYDRDEIKSMTFILPLGWTSVVLSKTSPSAVEVVVHQLDQQPPPPPPPPPPPASEEDNRTDHIVVQNEEINHQEPKQDASDFMTSKEIRNLVVIVATLLLQMAYQAGLNPPSGFWQDDLAAAAARSSAMAASSLAPAPLGGENGGDTVVPHQAGDPILRSKHRDIYLQFEWLNSLSLAFSSVLIVLPVGGGFAQLVRSRKAIVSHLGLLVAVFIMCMDMGIILTAYYVGAVSSDDPIIWLISYPAGLVAAMVAALVVYTIPQIIVYWIWRRNAKRQNN